MNTIIASQLNYDEIRKATEKSDMWPSVKKQRRVI